MQTPVEIDFQGMDARSDVRSSIEKHVAQLEQRFGRIIDGRVVLKAPGGHHRTGGLYEMHIHLSLPDGCEVNVGHTPQNDERYADLDFALNDFFKRARRQLQDQVRKLQGQIKQHEGLPVGTVKELDPLGEFGFLATPDGEELYFHRNSVLDDAYAELKPDDHVTYAEEMGDKGPQASTVKLLSKHSLRT